ncbi:arylamine N-acetyltransferase [Bacillus sp. FJAT-27225]|uniref:arylamine N-acetyltransferase family protein n=1 Tax=Bacillus sp. FJAT-27225 TaxID=1743144 RepID=UPI00080C32B0|nr:arylamine N-acetyltransferase [Bacillus sp. FJAT-27225]OCA90433.1 arylamine N-acetyltransferase [Bacillus sp. FJAT-27225]
MVNLISLFHKRIGYTGKGKIGFNDLDVLLEKTAMAIPFENLRIMEGAAKELSEENLIEKILVQHEGGLCYELNPLLFLILKDNGFDVEMVRGVVYDHSRKQWSETGMTHVAIILNRDGERYLVDTGFGGNLPLRPVPLNGEIVSSFNGEFRVARTETDYGDYIFHMKLSKDPDWKIGYAFNTREQFDDVKNLNSVQKVIVENPASAFNKKRLITKLTNSGSMTLTEDTFTTWTNGRLEKKVIEEKQFKEIAKDKFGLGSV